MLTPSQVRALGDETRAAVAGLTSQVTASLSGLHTELDRVRELTAQQTQQIAEIRERMATLECVSAYVPMLELLAANNVTCTRCRAPFSAERRCPIARIAHQPTVAFVDEASALRLITPQIQQVPANVQQQRGEGRMMEVTFNRSVRVVVPTVQDSVSRTSLIRHELAKLE